MDKAKVQIIGATGYAGGELYRLLLGHPGVDIVSLAAIIDKPAPISSFFPNLQGVSDQEVVLPDDAPKDGFDVVFLCTPHGVAMDLAEGYLKKNIKVIDISGDFRLNDPDEFKIWYKMEHRSPGLIKQAVYGMPELFRDSIRKAQLISNPGCFPTSAILPLAPAVKEKLIDFESIVIDSKTGVSGAGRKPNLLFHLPEAGANCSAYRIASHQHTPEIELYLGQLASKRLQVSFVPHLLPTSRGMLTTAYAELTVNLDLSQLRMKYADFYKGEPFIRLKSEMDRLSLGPVVGSNYCDIGVFLDERTNRLIAVSAIDNLVKGASGQAVQNFNIMFGFEETLGLTRAGWLI